jgi:hypothetical protein
MPRRNKNVRARKQSRAAQRARTPNGHISDAKQGIQRPRQNPYLSRSYAEKLSSYER